MTRVIVLALALASAGACGARPAPSATSGTTCGTSLTDTTFLSLRSVPVPAGPGVPLTCGPGTRGPAEVRLLTLTTRSGVAIGVGRGGQIYSLRVPGIVADLIPMRRPDAPFVDGVLQTVATNRAERRDSPRGAAAANGRNDRGPGWHYHQAGAYRRGVLADRPPTYSRIVAERLDAANGMLETLTLAVQAHPSAVPGDRFLAYSQLRAVDDDTIELTQGWINASRDDFGEAPTLDYFNFPYLTLNHDALPNVAVESRDVSAQPWPVLRGEQPPQGRWLAAFSATGVGMALVTGGTGRLRYGGRSIDVVDDAGSAQRQGIFVVSNVVTGRMIAPGEGVFATSYLVFGRREAVAAKAMALAGRPSLRTVTIDPSRSAAQVVALCGAQALAPCAGASPRFALAATLCTRCLPVFELARGAERVYSTEPYLGAMTGRYLSDPAYAIRRIVGWLYPVGAPVPDGFRAVPLAPGGPIRFDAKDGGRFSLLVGDRAPGVPMAPAAVPPAPPPERLPAPQ